MRAAASTVLASCCFVNVLACHDAATNPPAEREPPTVESDAGLGDDAKLAEESDAANQVEMSAPGQFGGQDAGTTRAHDTRVFTLDMRSLDLAAPSNHVETDRFSGLYEGGGYQIVPRVNGEVTTKVVTLHTLGDLYVPFAMEQIYRRRVNAHGHGDDVVQRATRGSEHCGFDGSEERAAFDALVSWVEHGVKPDGDDVLDRAVIADPDYGCKFTARPSPADPNNPPPFLSPDLQGPDAPPPPVATALASAPPPAPLFPSAPPCSSW
jgi:hypothetical protein